MAHLRPIRTVYVGIQEGYGKTPNYPLYTILEPMGEHCAKSTVSLMTIEKHGYRPVECKVPKCQGETLLA